MLESAADRLALVRDLGETVEIDGASVLAVFASPYQPVSLFSSTVQSESPELVLRDEDMPGSFIPGVTIIRVRGTDYRAVEVMPDGTGITMVRLQR